MYRYRNSLYLEDNEVDLKLMKYQSLLARRVHLLSYIDKLYKRCIVLDEKTVHNQKKLRTEWMFFSNEHFPTVPGLKLSLEQNSVRNSLFLSACFCWNSRLSLREMDQKFKIGGTIGYGDSYLEFLFRHFKVFRLHVKLHNAAGALRAQVVKVQATVT